MKWKKFAFLTLRQLSFSRLILLDLQYVICVCVFFNTVCIPSICCMSVSRVVLYCSGHVPSKNLKPLLKSSFLNVNPFVDWVFFVVVVVVLTQH